MKIKASIALAAAGLMAASCMPQGPRPTAVAARPPVSNTVEGTWADPNGIISTFQSGTFTTRTTDSNQLLASGTYVSVSPTLVEINMTSLVRNTQSKVNCALVNPSQLNCTSDAGSQFSLRRRS